MVYVPGHNKRKRGQPALEDTEDEKVLRQRRQAAERARKCRERRKIALHTRDETNEWQKAIDAAQALLGLSSSLDGSVQLMNAIDGRLELADPTDENHLPYRENDPSDKGFLQVTDVATIARLGHLSCHVSAVSSLAGSNDGRLALPKGVASAREKLNHVITDTIVPSELAGILKAREIKSGPNTNGPNDQFDGAQDLGIIYIDDDFGKLRNTHSTSEMSTLNYTLEKLYTQIVDGFHGCSQDDHARAMQDHVDQGGDNHQSLDEIFNDPTFPSVLNTPDIQCPAPLTRADTPSPSQWQAAFCDLSPN